MFRYGIQLVSCCCCSFSPFPPLLSFCCCLISNAFSVDISLFFFLCIFSDSFFTVRWMYETSATLTFLFCFHYYSISRPSTSASFAAVAHTHTHAQTNTARRRYRCSPSSCPQSRALLYCIPCWPRWGAHKRRIGDIYASTATDSQSNASTVSSEKYYFGLCPRVAPHCTSIPANQNPPPANKKVEGMLLRTERR